MKKFIQFLILGFSVFGFAQDGTIDPGFNPPAGAIGGNVSINAIATQSDGKIIVGGSFLILNNFSHGRLGRLNADGTIDDAFISGSGFDANVNSVSIQPDGKIVVTGSFTNYNGIAKNRIIRLNSDGTVDSTFNIGTGADNLVQTANIQPDGKIVIVGTFTSFNGVAKNRIVRLNADGTIDSTFLATGTTGNIQSCLSQPDGKILVSGNFTLFNGVQRNRIARLNADGTLDATFNPSEANGSVRAVCLQPDGKILIGGNFTSFNGTSAKYVARLNPDSTIDMTFNSGTGFNSYVNCITLQADGKFVIGGNFVSYNGATCNHIAKIAADGSIDAAFSLSPNSGTDNAVNAIVIQSNGKIVLGGTFSICNGFARNRIASLNANGSIDTGFYPFSANGLGINFNGQIETIALQPDGKIIIGGFFSTYNSVAVTNIARLNADGTIDETFNVGTGTDEPIKKIVITSDNKIIIAGDFNSYNGIAKNHIARLNANGTLDTTFNASILGSAANTVAIQTDGKLLVGGSGIKRLNANGTPDASFITPTGPPGGFWTISIQSDNKIVVGGDLSTYNGSPVGGITRLNIDGTVDSTFSTGGVGITYFIYTTTIQSDGKIIVGGAFDDFNNIVYNGLVRLNANGSLDSSFNCTTLDDNSVINASVVQSDGKIIIGGNFHSFNGFTGKNIMRLNADGTLDNSFIQGTGFNSYVGALTLQGDGKILAGGGFFSYNGISQNKISRLYTSNNLNLSNFNGNDKLSIYPNPANDYLNFSFSKEIHFSSFEVFDITGKRIKSNVLNENRIDVREYADGIYFLRINTDEGSLNSKFIKE